MADLTSASTSYTLALLFQRTWRRRDKIPEQKDWREKIEGFERDGYGL